MPNKSSQTTLKFLCTPYFRIWMKMIIIIIVFVDVNWSRLRVIAILCKLMHWTTNCFCFRTADVGGLLQLVFERYLCCNLRWKCLYCIEKGLHAMAISATTFRWPVKPPDLAGTYLVGCDTFWRLQKLDFFLYRMSQNKTLTIKNS